VHCSIWATSGQAQTSWAGGPLAKPGEALDHGARAGAAMAGRIPSEGQRGTVGQRAGEEAGEEWTPIWGIGWGDAHWRTLPVMAQSEQRNSPVLGRRSDGWHRLSGRRALGHRGGARG
jgi:hypothetical protein